MKMSMSRCFVLFWIGRLLLYKLHTRSSLLRNIRRPATLAWSIKPLLIVPLADDGSTRTKTVISWPAAAMVMMVCGGASSEPWYIIIGCSSLFPRERKLWCKQQRHVKHHAARCVCARAHVCVCVCNEAFAWFGRFSFSSILIFFFW